MTQLSQGYPLLIREAFRRQTIASFEASIKSSDAISTVATNIYPTSPLQQFGFAIIFFFPALASIVVVLRVYGRLTKKQFGWDDALVILAWILSWIETGLTSKFMQTNYVGIHIWDVPLTNDPVPGLIYNFAVQVAYNPILALVKTSVLLFLLRLGRQKQGVSIAIHSLNAFNIAQMVAIFLTVVFQCSPIPYNWDKTIEGGHCVDQALFYVVTAGLTILTDLLVLGLPFWIFLDLQMPRKQKVALLGVFFLGFVVTGVGIARLVILYLGFYTPANSDPTYTIGFTSSAIETNLAIITASAPALRPLLVQWFPRIFSSSKGDSQAYNTGDRYANNLSSSAPKSKTGHRSTHAGTYVLNDLGGRSGRTEIRSVSPSASEEEIMTYNGIMKTTNVRVDYADKTREKGDNSSKDSYSMRTDMSNLEEEPQ